MLLYAFYVQNMFNTWIKSPRLNTLEKVVLLQRKVNLNLFQKNRYRNEQSKQHQLYKYLCNHKEHNEALFCLLLLLYTQFSHHDFMHFFCQFIKFGINLWSKQKVKIIQ